jgi:large subunit ribosomal protein L17
MQHQISGNKLNRKMSHRKATMRDIAKAVFLRERILTTLAKAKEGRKLTEKLITLGKKGTLADMRRAFAVLCDHQLVSYLFKDIAPRFSSRNGGYTRIIKLNTPRRGDGASMVYLELVEKKEIKISKGKKAAKKEKQEPVVEAAGTEKTVPEKHKGSEVKKEAKPVDKKKKLGIKTIFSRKVGSE